MRMQVICFSLKMCINYQIWTMSLSNENSTLHYNWTIWSYLHKTKLKEK